SLTLQSRGKLPSPKLPGIRDQAYCKTAQSQLIWQNTNSLNTNKLYLLKIRLRGLSWLRWLRGCSCQKTVNRTQLDFFSYLVYPHTHTHSHSQQPTANSQQPTANIKYPPDTTRRSTYVRGYCE